MWRPELYISCVNACHFISEAGFSKNLKSTGLTKLSLSLAPQPLHGGRGSGRLRGRAEESRAEGGRSEGGRTERREDRGRGQRKVGPVGEGLREGGLRKKAWALMLVQHATDQPSSPAPWQHF